MEKKRIVMSLGLVIAVAALGGVVLAAELHLPPAGEDTFPATKLELEFVTSLGETQTLTCAGPTTIQRSDPQPGPTGQIIETEIVELNLVCSGGASLRLNPDIGPSSGQVDSNGDSFFNVFFEVDTQFGPVHNIDAAQMVAKVAHVAPFHAIYLGAVPIPVFDPFGNFVGTITHMTHETNGQTKPETTGEVSPVFSCFYECKPHKFDDTVWVEMTSLMLINQSTKQELTAQVVLLDGNQNIIAIAPTQLGPLDLDEINICATLENNLAGVPVPQAGVIEVVLTPGWGGAYGWVKDVVGGFKRDQPEPVSGFIRSVGKTECRLVGENVTTPFEILTQLDPALFISPVLIEGTDDTVAAGDFCFDPVALCQPCVAGTICPDGTACGPIAGCP